MQISYDDKFIYLTNTGSNWGSGCSLSIHDIELEDLTKLIDTLQNIKKEKYPNG